MNILSIKESGSNDILRWAISSGAEVKKDFPLISVVNNDLFYTVQLSDVNFFELFRLTQLYRDKIRILDEKKAEVPDQNELMKYFDGTYCPDKNDSEKKAPLYEIVEYAVTNFINLALQMNSDNDIIKTNAARLFIPMISRKFDIQIPVSFVDFVESMTEDEASEVFNNLYPQTLDQILSKETHGVKTMLQCLFVKSTATISYNKRYSQYLKITKYGALNTYNNQNTLYRFALIGCFKYNSITKDEIRFGFFNPDQKKIGDVLKKLAFSNEPLKIEFVVQLPIQYMQILENSFSAEDLPTLYESCMSDIIDGGLNFNDFNTWEDGDNEEETVKTPEYEVKVEKMKNEILAYKTRIAEANNITLSAIPILLENPDNADGTNTFAMLPSAYTTKAVLVLDMTKKDKYLNASDPLIAEMFTEMLKTAEKIIEDINSSK